MPALTAAQIASLRMHPHRFADAQYLYVHVPRTILQARCATAGRDQWISYVVGAGDETQVQRGQTLWVSDTAYGQWDKGTVRIRAINAPGNQLNVSEHEILLEAGVQADYLTVVDEYRLWHVDPYITNAGVIYKDCDDASAPTTIAFPGANQIYQPVPVMGPHSIEFIESGVATHQWDWTNSWAIAPGAAVASYLATFPGENPTDAPSTSVAATGSVTWATSGARWVELVVTDSNAVACYSGKRLYVSLDGTEDDLYVDFQPGPRTGTVSGGGFTMSFTVWADDCSEENFPDGALVFWFTDGGTQESIGGNWPHRSHIRFIGFIKAGSTHKEPETGNVTFEAETVHGPMGALPVFPNFIEIDAAPTVWTEAASLTVQRAATLHTRWMSSLLEVADVLFVPDADTAIGEHEFAEGDLLTQLRGLVEKDFMYRVGCDYQGTVYVNKDPQYLDLVERASVATIMTLVDQDWQGEIDLQERLRLEVAYIMASGAAYAAGVVTPLFSEAPGPVPLPYGTRDRGMSRLILTDQAQLNTLSGLALAHRNNDLPDIPLRLAGQYYGLDHLFPMEFVGLNPTTKRGYDLSGESFVPRRSTLTVQTDQDGAFSHGQVDVNVEKLTFGPDGQTLLWPTSLTPSDPEDSPWGWPPTGGGVPGPTYPVGSLFYLVCGNGVGDNIIRSRNVLETNPTHTVYEGLAMPGGSAPFEGIALDAFDPKNRAMVCGENGIYRTTNLDATAPTFTLVRAPTYAIAHGFTHIVSSTVTEDLWMAVEQAENVGGGGFTYIIVHWTIDGGDTWSSSQVATDGWDAGLQYAKIEASTHSDQRAWVTYISDDGANHWLKAVRTTDQWATNGTNTWGGALATDPLSIANPHHRHDTNPNDQWGLWAAYINTTQCNADWGGVCNAGNVTACTAPDPTADGILWTGSYPSATNIYWCLSWCNDTGDFYFNIDADAQGAWTRRFTFDNATYGNVLRGANWPYDSSRYYVGCEGAPTAPLAISQDAGVSWTLVTGNWAALLAAHGWAGGARDLAIVPVA